MEQFKLFLNFSEGSSTLPRFKKHKNTWPHTWKMGLAAELLWSAKTGQGGCCQRVWDWQGMKEVVSLWWIWIKNKKKKEGEEGEAGGGGVGGWKTTSEAKQLVKRATVALNVKAEVGRKEEGEGGKISCNWRVRRLSIAGIGWKV